MKQIKQVQSFYTSAQIRAYMERIEFPSYPSSVGSSFRANLSNLEQIVRLHLIAFPFENSRMHYSVTHEVDVSPQSVYNRLVETRQGGSWCCGQNGLLLGVLRGLGYRAYASASRVNASPPTSKEPLEYTFLTHMVLFVQIDEEFPRPGDQSAVIGPNREGSKHTTSKYMVDVGFGGTGPVRPLRLQVGHTVPGSAPPEEHRLIRGPHPLSSLEDDDSSRDWFLQYRCGSHQPEWRTLYLFGESETFPRDWVAYSQWLSQNPQGPFVSNVLCIRHFVAEVDSEAVTKGEDSNGELPIGKLVMMGRKVQKRIGDRSETVREFSEEKERIQILKEDFGIVVGEDELQNIAHTSAALPVD